MSSAAEATLSADGGVHADLRVYTIVELTRQGLEAGNPLPPYVFDMSDSTGLRNQEKHPEIADIADVLIESIATEERDRIQTAQAFTIPADLRSIRLHAHRMFGVASNLRQEELQKPCKLLERAALELEKEDNASRLADATVQEELTHLLAVINARLMMIVNWFDEHGAS
jgi:HPt (histidine-containing phosphotransfer) domain-containing protein